MDASSYKPGDRVRLVCMDDPFREPPEDTVGTVLGFCPKPINVVDVEWDNGFSLNPCLDSDIIQKVGSVAAGRTFYSVGEDEYGTKYIQYQGRTERDDDGYRLVTVSGCFVPLGTDSVAAWDALEQKAEMCAQWDERLVERTFYKMNRTFFAGNGGKQMEPSEVSPRTPNGDYYFEGVRDGE